MRKKGVLLFLGMLLLASIVHAQSFSVDVGIINNTITFDQDAKFKLTISNNLAIDQLFRIKTFEYPMWDIRTDPLYNPITLYVPAAKSKSIEILVDPLGIITLGVYDVNVNVKSETQKEAINVPVRVSIVSPSAGKYVPTVILTIMMDPKIDPTKPIPIKIKLDNQNPLEYKELTVKLDSSLIKDVVKAKLDKKEKKIIELTKEIDPKTEPKEDTLVVSVLSGDSVIDTKVERIEVIGHKELTKEETSTKTFLKNTKNLKYANVGNTRYAGNVQIESSFYTRLFTSSKPKGTFIKEGKDYYLSWNVDVPIGESIKIEVTENYRPLLFIVLLLIIVGFLYVSYRSPLILRKTATNIETKEGGVSELKVVLTIVNRSRSPLKDIEIVDRIPKIIDLEKGLSIGTLHPSKVLKHEKYGTMVKWVIDELGADDERVISYKIRSHLSILGEFTLKAAAAKFRFRGQEVITHSNSLGVSP